MTVFVIIAAALVANSAMKLAQRGWDLSARMLAFHCMMVVFGLLTLIGMLLGLQAT